MMPGLFPPTLGLIDTLTKKRALSRTRFSSKLKPYEYFREKPFNHH